MEKQFKKYYIIQFVLLFFSLQVFSQKAEGKVTNTDNEPVMGATVTVNNKYFGMTNGEGVFSINIPSPLKECNVRIESIGFKLYEKNVSLKKTQFLNVVLEKETNQLDEVVLQFKTKAELLREEAYAVEVIESKSYKNLSVNANEILSKVSGVNIRQSGGLGANAVLSVNGLSGSQVRLFIDGIPMEFFGTSLSLGNFPSNLIEQIEVYKGVVPIHLSGDALGAAINITTNTGQKSFLDASYSFGSFNTHIASINGQYRNKENGFTARLKSFYNYSDNNYNIDVNLYTLETGKHDDFTTEVERFHDTYKSKMAWGEVGFTKVDYADVLMLGLLYSDNYDEIQQPPNALGDNGDVLKKEQKIITTLNFSKDHFLNENLSLKTYLVGVLSSEYTRDISSYTYNWLGEATLRDDAGTGEADQRKTKLNLNSKNILGNINLGYVFSDVNNLGLNYSLNFLNQEGEDPYNGENNTRFGDPLTFNKQVLSASYTHAFFKKSFKNSIFTKYYKYDQKSTDSNYGGTLAPPTSADYDHVGYGFTSTYFLKDFQFKTSFEHAVRFPDAIELYGDGLGIAANLSLVPEESDNYNLGVIYKTSIKEHNIMFSINGFVRNAKNFIYISPGIPSEYKNSTDVLSRGIDFSANYNFNQKINFSIAGTYTSKVNNEKYLNGNPNSLYAVRLPNDPYIYGNSSLTYTTRSLLEEEDTVSLTINENFVEEFYYGASNLGSSSTKYIVPSQLTTNIDFLYSTSNKKYNISLGVTNLFNAKTYDNLFQQNPGRWFNIKLRYFIN